uniref:Uncharacterized protein n=1 Tax=Mesocestoides corti TaxID=53468 RepID=A0A5K3FD52_MESCO
MNAISGVLDTIEPISELLISPNCIALSKTPNQPDCCVLSGSVCDSSRALLWGLELTTLCTF